MKKTLLNFGAWLASGALLVFMVIYLSAKDALAEMRKKPNGRRSQWWALNAAAGFAALIGFGIWRMAVASENPMADRQFWAIFLLPGLVYLIVILGVLHHIPMLIAKNLAAQLMTQTTASKRQEERK